MVNVGAVVTVKGAQLKVLSMHQRKYCDCCRGHLIARCEVVAMIPMHADSPAKRWDVGWVVELDARVLVKADLGGL